MMGFGLGALGATRRGGFGSGGALGTVPVSGGAAPGAPTLVRMTAATDSGSSNSDAISNDTTPDFTINLPFGNGSSLDAVAGDVLHVYSDGVDVGSGTLNSGHISGNTIDLTITPLSSGVHAITAKLFRGAASSPLSNSINITIDATAPVLSSAAGTQTGTSTANLSVGTDTASGTGYWVVSTSATPPSAAQVKAGQNASGTAAAASGSGAVSGATFTPTAAGLSASTGYYAYFMQEDVAGNQSSVAASAQFTTAASGASAIFTDHTFDNTDKNTPFKYSFTSRAIGSASADRQVVVAVSGKNLVTSTIASVVIGGVTATQVVSAFANNIAAALYVASVPTGTTATIDVTFNDTQTRCGIGVWALYGASTTIPSGAAINTQTGFSAAQSKSVTIPVNGAAIAFSVSTTSATVTPSGNVTQDFLDTFEVFDVGVHGAFPAGGATTISMTWSVAPGSGASSVWAAWGP